MKSWILFTFFFTSFSSMLKAEVIQEILEKNLGHSFRGRDCEVVVTTSNREPGRKFYFVGYSDSSPQKNYDRSQTFYYEVPNQNPSNWDQRGGKWLLSTTEDIIYVAGAEIGPYIPPGGGTNGSTYPATLMIKLNRDKKIISVAGTFFETNGLPGEVAVPFALRDCSAP